MGRFSPKRRLVEALARHYRIESIRGLDVIALNSKAILYLRYNKNAGGTRNLLGKFWFGITKSEYERYSGENFFIVCACVFGPDEVDYVVFPSETFDEVREDIVLQSGQWKFNLLKTTERRYFLQLPGRGRYDVTQFVNYFDFSPSQLRAAYLPKLGDFERKAPRQEVLPTPEERLPLEVELPITAKDSANPKNFEVAVEKFFLELGFHCRRIGGAGETDVLVEEPARFIVDGKTTTAHAKSAINFTRIKRHMRQHGAQFMAIVSVGFDPAVCRDAEVEQATLIDIETLVTLLKIHREHLLSPFDYLEVFREPGLVTSETMSPLKRTIDRHQTILTKSVVLLENLDFGGRSTDEIKGRADLYCEQNQREKLDKSEIESLLAFLSHELLGVIKCEDGAYSLRFTPALCQERLKSTIRVLCTEAFQIK